MLQEAFCAMCERNVQIDSTEPDPSCPVCSSPLATVQLQAPEQPISRPKVLIVDDDEGTRHLIMALFEHDGYEVVGEAAHGVAAVGVAMSRRPDFVILDYAMPMLSGKMTSELLRAILPDAFIVAFSAYLLQKPSWADAFVNKEDLSDLTSVVAQLAVEKDRPAPAELDRLDRLPLSVDPAKAGHS